MTAPVSQNHYVYTLHPSVQHCHLLITHGTPGTALAETISLAGCDAGDEAALRPEAADGQLQALQDAGFTRSAGILLAWWPYSVVSCGPRRTARLNLSGGPQDTCTSLRVPTSTLAVAVGPLRHCSSFRLCFGEM